MDEETGLKPSTLLMLEAFAELPTTDQLGLIDALRGDMLFEAMIDQMMNNLQDYSEEGEFDDVTTPEEAHEALLKMM
jgi:hypothetical protein